MSGIRSASCGKLSTACYQRFVGFFNVVFLFLFSGERRRFSCAQNRLRRERMQRLRLFTGDDHPFKHMLSPVPGDSNFVSLLLCKTVAQTYRFVAAHLQYVPKLKVMPDDEESLAEIPGL